MIEVPENGSIWVSGVAAVISVLSFFRDRGNDADRRITAKVEPLSVEFKAHRAYVEGMLREHLAYRRDLDEYKQQQEKSLERIEEGLQRQFDELKEMVKELNGLMLRRGGT